MKPVWRRRLRRAADIAIPWAATGGALGALVRNQATAVVAALLAALVVEPVLIALVPEVARFGPFAALPTAALGLSAEQAALPAGIDLLPAGLAALALLGWIAAALGAASALLRRRDLE